jgi:hypothetical protein
MFWLTSDKNKNVNFTRRSAYNSAHISLSIHRRMFPAKVLAKNETHFTFSVHFSVSLAVFEAIKANTICVRGHAVAYLVEALCYKPEDRGFESR